MGGCADDWVPADLGRATVLTGLPFYEPAQRLQQASSARIPPPPQPPRWARLTYERHPPVLHQRLSPPGGFCAYPDPLPRQASTRVLRGYYFSLLPVSPSFSPPLAAWVYSTHHDQAQASRRLPLYLLPPSLSPHRRRPRSPFELGGAELRLPREWLPPRLGSLSAKPSSVSATASSSHSLSSPTPESPLSSQLSELGRAAGTRH